MTAEEGMKTKCTKIEGIQVMYKVFTIEAHVILKIMQKLNSPTTY